MSQLRAALSRLVFDLGADFYAWMTWQETWRAHCGSLADYFPPPPPGRPLRVLDLGIGPGISGIGLHDRRPDAAIVGADFSPRMLRLARRYVRRAGARLQLVRADAMNLPCPDGSFDVVTHHSFLYLVQSRPRVLSEIRRVLRPGGAYVILEPHRAGRLHRVFGLGGSRRFRLSMFLWRLFARGYGPFAPDELATLLGGHGFGAVRIEETLGGLGLLACATRQ